MSPSRAREDHQSSSSQIYSKPKFRCHASCYHDAVCARCTRTLRSLLDWSIDASSAHSRHPALDKCAFDGALTSLVAFTRARGLAKFRFSTPFGRRLRHSSASCARLSKLRFPLFLASTIDQSGSRDHPHRPLSRRPGQRKADDRNFLRANPQHRVYHANRSAANAGKQPSTSVDKNLTLYLHQEWG